MARKAKAKKRETRKSSKTPTDFSGFVEHPRYGRGPRYTGLDPHEDWGRPGHLVYFGWHSSPETRIPNTAIVADISKQAISTMGVTHYFDEVRTCGSCRKPFLFFAEEQRHWYEELGFSLEACCNRCVYCRREQQHIARDRARYEELCHVEEPSPAELVEQAECCLTLMEEELFSPHKAQFVRSVLNRLSESRGRPLRRRLERFEASLEPEPES